jgi:hypothetical protein
MNGAVAKQSLREQKTERLFDVADRQAGYFMARQALEAGFGYPLQHYHRERGHWIQVGHGLFRLNRYPEGENEDLVRLYLSGAATGKASHRPSSPIRRRSGSTASPT